MPGNLEPDRGEKRIRFGCGFLLFGPVAFLTIACWMPDELLLAAILALLVGIGAGVLATVLGDRFWERAVPLLRWWNW